MKKKKDKEVDIMKGRVSLNKPNPANFIIKVTDALLDFGSNLFKFKGTTTRFDFWVIVILMFLVNSLNIIWLDILLMIPYVALMCRRMNDIGINSKLVRGYSIAYFFITLINYLLILLYYLNTKVDLEMFNGVIYQFVKQTSILSGVLNIVLLGLALFSSNKFLIQKSNTSKWKHMVFKTTIL